MKTAVTSRFARRVAVILAVAGVLGLTASASAQDQRTPDSFNYDLKNGKPVPKGQRVDNPDGSWREEVRKGRCVAIKEKTASGEIRKWDECKPK